MPSVRTRLTLAMLGALLLLGVAAAPGVAASRPDSRIPGAYVVVYEDGVTNPGARTDQRERAHGFKSRLRYSRAVKGFAARLNARQVERLRSDPAVAFVAPDRRVRASGPVALASGEPVPPTGVRRVEAGTSSTVRAASGAGVAVLDTGIDLGHPDLGTAVHGTNCVTAGASAQDDHGHGTHVAGSIAAENDGAGVTGVAPGTALHAVKVLDASGSGTTSQIVCGIDWVTRNAAALDIRVANMSLGGGGSPIKDCATTTDPQHKAICSSTAAGVTYVAAAGNSGWDFDYARAPDVPAAYPEVLTVTAMSDSDGAPGATGGAPACRTSEGDDRYASFSNYAATSAGAAHTIAAPGVCIRSTWKAGAYATISGTSMAAPHVAAAAALCLDEGGSAGPCAGLAPAQILARLRDDARRHSEEVTGYGFAGDPLRPVSGRYFGHLDWRAASTVAPVPDSTAPAAPAGLTATAGEGSVTLAWTANTEEDLAGYRVYLVEGDGSLALVGSPATAGFVHTGLTAGTTYTYVVKAADASGNLSEASAPASATPTAPAIALSARGYKHKGQQRVDLKWSGASGTSVDVWRNGSRLTTTANDGAHTDSVPKGAGTYRYRVCQAGTTTCSAEVAVSFG